MDESDTMPPEKAMEVADDLVEMGVKAVTFSGGGEPLIYRPLPDIVERLARGGVKVASLTNGAALKGRMADAFATHATWVRISIDGWDGPSYAKARHVPEDEFDRVIGNMRDFAARGSDCVLGVTYYRHAGKPPPHRRNGPSDEGCGRTAREVLGRRGRQ